jgi:penicillin-binding protein 1A
MADTEVPRITNSSQGRPAPSRIHSRRIFGQLAFLTLLLMAAGVGSLAGLVFVYSANLPQVRALLDYRPDVMTEIYADDGTVIGRFALERRVLVTYDQIPAVLKNAVLSIEDRHFEDHIGVDVIRILRAGGTDVLEWRKAQGASTLTMQLSRILFLTPEKSFRRKFQELLLTIQIERQFTKPQIFTMYCNQVGLGGGSYGFEAASEYYFGKHVGDLTLPEAALLAGLPKTPTAFSPVLHPERALQRRNQVLLAMLENGKITPKQYREAKAAPLGLHVQKWNNEIAPYFVEDVREFLEKKYGAEAVNENGLRVYTTLNLSSQRLAVAALRQGLRDDDKGRGWRGPEENILKSISSSSPDPATTLDAYTNDDWKKPLEPESLVHGLVVEVKPDYALVRFGKLTARVTPKDFAWTRETTPHDLFSPGDVDLFLVKEIKGRALHVILDQHPDVEGALVAIENHTGAIKAMVGGYDFNESKFNRAVQAERQVGSSFKVYVYTQALMDGENPFDTVVDEPISYPASSGVWAPHNYDNKFEGRITLLHALAESRNVPAVRLLARVGVDRVIKLCRKFGITSRLASNLPLALGASDLTLLEHTSAFTAFVDDGLHVSPRLIDRVTDYDGRVIDEFTPQITDVIAAPIARLMVSMLREPINSGTAVRAKSLAQKYPLAGKTGTTNDFTDAWFIGFSPSLTCGVWVGFDDHRSLGDKEEGSHVALPIWMQFMEETLKNSPVEAFPYSPVLTSPEQVKEILATTAPESLLAQRSAPGALRTPGTESRDRGSAGAELPGKTGSEVHTVSSPSAEPNGGPSTGYLSRSATSPPPVAKPVPQEGRTPPAN